MRPRSMVLQAGLMAGGCLLALPAQAVELQLESIKARRGDTGTELRLGGRATFDFDPGSGVLRATGTFTAEYPLPGQQSRFAHKLEDLVASADGSLRMKSYECVEGTLGGPFLGVSLCGNYRFGPNGVDEGGFGDDVSAGAPRSLVDWQVEGLEWDGNFLAVSLVPPGGTGGDLFPEQGLTLRLRPPPGL